MATDRPLTLDALVQVGALGGFIAPTGPFDPNGEWDHLYRIWLYDTGDRGSLRVQHTATAPGENGVLTVTQTVNQSAGSVHKTNASIQFTADALATPYSWQIDSVIEGLDSQPIESSRVQETGAVSGSEIHVTAGGQTFIRPKPAAFTCNWSLFDAVQRLPGASTTPLDFDLLEEFDLLKEGQRLSFQESRDLVVNSQTLHLTGYHLIGEGVLPYEFWVDDQHRLLFAFAGIRVYVFDHVRTEVFRETWNAATVPQTFAPGASGPVAGSDRSWTYTVQANSGSLAIVEDTPGGNRRLESSGGGGATANQAFFSSKTLSIAFDDYNAVTINAAIRLNEVGTTDPRTVQVALYDGQASPSGFAIQFNGNTSKSPLALMVWLAGASTQVTTGAVGQQTTGETYLVTATFARSGTDTNVNYQVQKASGGNLIAPNTKTIAGATLPAGVTLSEAKLTFKQLAACAVDDVAIEV